MGAQDERPRLLVVDDEAGNLDTFRRVFRKDFVMTFASSAAEAVEKAGGQEFDVALVDYAMPGETGLMFLIRAPKLQPKMACLMLTAHADLDEVKSAFSTGLVYGIIMKPWDRDTILRWVTNAMRMGKMKKSIGEMKSSVDKK